MKHLIQAWAKYYFSLVSKPITFDICAAFVEGFRAAHKDKLPPAEECIVHCYFHVEAPIAEEL